MSTTDLNELLVKARALGGPSTMAPGVFDAEAHVAAWHAIAIQGGFTSPEREAWRLAADYRSVSRAEAAANTRAVTNESPVNMALVAEIVGTLGDPAPVAQPETNDRGEFVDASGNMWHTGGEGFQPGSGVPTFTHEGDWLSCEGCNPPVVVDASSATDSASRLADLRDEYAMAKDQSGIAEERLKAAKSKLQAAIAEASGGAYRVELRVPGFKPVTLVYTEPWTLDSKALKAEQPAVYVQYAKRGQRWTLAESRAKS